MGGGQDGGGGGGGGEGVGRCAMSSGLCNDVGDGDKRTMLRGRWRKGQGREKAR